MSSGQPPTPPPQPPADDSSAAAQPAPNDAPASAQSPSAEPRESEPTEERDAPAAAASAGDSATTESAPGGDAEGAADPAAPASESSPRPGSALARGSGPLAARGLGVAKPASPAAGKIGSQGGKERGGKGSGTGPKQRGGGAKPSSPAAGKAFRTSGVKVPGEAPVDDRANSPGETDPASAAAPQSADADEPKASAPSNAPPAGTTRRVEVPNLRQPLGDDLLAEWEAELSSADVDAMLKEPAGLQKRPASIEEGEKVRGTVLKTDEEAVYVSLGGPDEGAVPRDQFDELPTAGQSLELVVRGFNREDGLYQLVVPGQAMDVSDWDDLDEGAVVEAHVTAANTGGLEATVGSIRGFIPISQIAIYRVEDTAEFVGQRMVCLVTECNPRRKNLVLSRRAILEREREEQRQQQLEQIEPGDSLEGTVSSLKDFGAFVDLGGLDGLIHISRLSWDNVKHPGEVLEVGQKVKVKVEKIDKQTGKIALSYRDLLENPWDSIEATCPVGSVVTGTVTRLANFGAFVKISAGIEGLVHISEIASHRVSNVNSVLKEGEQVQVKVLSVERESQRIALSVKQAQSKAASGETKTEEPADEPPREPAVRRQHAGPLKGGVGGGGDDNPFGLKLG